VGGRSADKWPQESAAWSVYPSGAAPEPGNHCRPGDTACVMALAAFGLGTGPAGGGQPAVQQLQPASRDVVQQRDGRVPEGTGPARVPESFPLERTARQLGIVHLSPCGPEPVPRVLGADRCGDCPCRRNGVRHRPGRRLSEWRARPAGRLQHRPLLRGERIRLPAQLHVRRPGRRHRRQGAEHRPAARMRLELRDPSQRMALAVAGDIPRNPEGGAVQLRGEPIRQDVLPVRRGAGHAGAGVVLQGPTGRQAA
jgi:hypothetical protein